MRHRHKLSTDTDLDLSRLSDRELLTVLRSVQKRGDTARLELVCEEVSRRCEDNDE
jgi:hypothetical protein